MPGTVLSDALSLTLLLLCHESSGDSTDMIYVFNSPDPLSTVSERTNDTEVSQGYRTSCALGLKILHSFVDFKRVRQVMRLREKKNYVVEKSHKIGFIGHMPSPLRETEIVKVASQCFRMDDLQLRHTKFSDATLAI